MTGTYSPGDVAYFEFPISSSTGAAVNADSTPTVSVYKNGTVDAGVSVTISNPSTGRYTCSFTIPTTYVPGDQVRAEATATVSSIAIPSTPVFNCRLDLSLVVQAGTAQAGAASTITLASGASATNDLYKGMLVRIFSGTGVGQLRTITGYVGSTKVATIGRAWATNPDSTSLYAVVADQSALLSSSLGVTVAGYEASQDPATLLLVNPTYKLLTDSSGRITPIPGESMLIRSGTAAAGAASTITLDAGASATNNLYKGAQIIIYGGTGAGQAPRTITAYVGSTQVATVDRAWVTNPDNTSLFKILCLEGAVLSASLGLNVAGYETGQDPATLTWGAGTRTLSAQSDSAGVTTLLTRIASNLTITGGKVSALLASTDVTGNVPSVVNAYASGQDPKTLLEVAGGILDVLQTRLSSARAGFLDWLNIGGLVASHVDVTGIQNNTRVVITVPEIIERPDTGTTTSLIRLYMYDETGHMNDPDSNTVNVTVKNSAGTDYTSTRLSAATMTRLGAGRYQVTYTGNTTDTIEQLLWEFSMAENSQTLYYTRGSWVFDTTAIQFGSSDRSDLQAAKAAALAAQTRAEIALPASAPGAAGGVALVGNAMTLTSAYDAAKTAAQPGDAMSLTSGERTTLAGVIKTAMEVTGGFLELLKTRVLKAIPDAIYSTTSGLPLKSDITSGGGSSGTNIYRGPFDLTALDSGDDCTFKAKVGDLYPVILRALIDGLPPSVTGGTWTASTYAVSTGTLISEDISVEVMHETLGFFAYQLQAADTASARRVELLLKRVLDGNTLTFGPLIINVKR